MVSVRPVDRVLEFLQARRDSGTSHVYLDDSVRGALRSLHRRLKDRPPGHQKNSVGVTPPSASVPAPSREREPVSAEIQEYFSLSEHKVLAGSETSPHAPAPPPALVTLRTAGDTKAARLDDLRRQAESWDPARRLGTLRETMVFAAGNPDARLMLVGEAPGYEEERKGEPFVGPAGRKLDEILKAMGVSREEIYISNLVKFRPATPRQTTNNRKPNAAEMAACLPLLREEIAIVRPECLVAMGGTAAEGLLGLKGPVGSMRGRWHDFDGIPARVTYHPSYLLQSGGSMAAKRQLWEDMLAVMERLSLALSAKQRGYFLPKE